MSTQTLVPHLSSLCLFYSQGHDILHSHLLLCLFWIIWPLHCTGSDSLSSKIAATVISVFFFPSGYCLQPYLSLVLLFPISPTAPSLVPNSFPSRLVLIPDRTLPHKRQFSIILISGLKLRQRESHHSSKEQKLLFIQHP